ATLKKLMTRYAGIIVVFSLVSVASAEPERVDKLLEPIVKDWHVPGMVAARLEGNEIVAIGAAGVRKFGGEATITIDDQFHIGSDTKAMTATLLAMLVEEGKLVWGSTLAQIYPDLAENMHPDWKDVTLEQLLTHRAGAPGHIETTPVWGKL